MSDCGAILDMQRLTPYAATPEDAVAYAFNAGVYIPTFLFFRNSHHGGGWSAGCMTMSYNRMWIDLTRHQTTDCSVLDLHVG